MTTIVYQSAAYKRRLDALNAAAVTFSGGAQADSTIILERARCFEEYLTTDPSEENRP